MVDSELDILSKKLARLQSISDFQKTEQWNEYKNYIIEQSTESVVFSGYAMGEDPAYNALRNEMMRHLQKGMLLALDLVDLNLERVMDKYNSLIEDQELESEAE